jgi:hypothetical protein
MPRAARSGSTMKILAVALLGAALLVYLKVGVPWLHSRTAALKAGGTYALRSDVLACPADSGAPAPARGAGTQAAADACLTLPSGTRIRVSHVDDHAAPGTRAVFFSLPGNPARGELWTTDALVVR